MKALRLASYALVGLAASALLFAAYARWTGVDATVEGPAGQVAADEPVEGPSDDAPLVAESQALQGRLVLAARTGDVSRLRALLEEGASPNEMDTNGDRPLQQAAAFGTTEAITLLIERDADVNAQDGHGWTPLMWASFQGVPAAVEVLLDAEADPNIQFPPNHVTALEAVFSGWATERSDPEELKADERAAIVQRLLAADADPNQYGASGPPLRAALILTERADVVQALLDNGASLEDLSQSDLQFFVRRSGPMGDVLRRALDPERAQP